MNDIIPFSLHPTTLKEAMQFSDMIARSSLCPPQFKNKPGDVLICIQYGAELGLNPMQALQSISVINNRACIWGDGALAVVQRSSAYGSHKEWYEGKLEDGTLTAFCAVTRKGSPEYIKSFSIDDAKKANLWSKPGVWQQYPSRMLQMRARAFAIRDQFSDALKGLQIKEEVEDYETKIIKITQDEKVQEPEKTLDKYLSDMKTARTTDDLRRYFQEAYQKYLDSRPLIEQVKNEVKAKLEALEDGA